MQDGFFYDYIIISCIFFDGGGIIAEIETVPLRFFYVPDALGCEKNSFNVFTVETVDITLFYPRAAYLLLSLAGTKYVL